MELKALTVVLSLLSVVTARAASTPISELRRQIQSSSHFSKRDTNPALLYPAYNLSVPIDHFHNESMYEPHSNGMFNLRYWFDASHYQPGGPVIMLASGETSGVNRLPFLQKGIVSQLAQVTHGVGVILEHRYYGTSIPTPDLSTENLRFLTTEQALADTAYFAQNVVFKGLEGYDLTAPHTAWIAYGGSYAGAFVAFLRTLYPSDFWGAISSSGVTEAIYDYWEYYEPVREYGPPDCIRDTQLLTNVVDNILLNNTAYTAALKAAFGLSNVTYDNDFANLLSYGIGGWQGRNWDPAVNDPSFSYYCGNLTSTSVVHPSAASLTSSVDTLLTAAGYGAQISTLETPMLNYIGFIKTTYILPCARQNLTQDQCFSNHNSTFYSLDDITQLWRSWPYQYCTQWGYLQTGSGVPPDQLPLISRTIDLNYSSIICREAFNITTPPNVTAINQYGGYNISYPRLAIIDGEADPWRPVTPHGSAAPNRTSTASEPFILIPGAVHHWDENGLFANETIPGVLPPPQVADTQAFEAMFVQEWMQEWQLHCLIFPGACWSRPLCQVWCG